MLQFSMELITSAQPVVHASCPAGQVASQRPDTQRVPAAQAFPHDPQEAESLWVSTQREAPPASQRCSDPGHAQVPALHVCPASHAVPHAPQFIGSLRRSRQLAPQALSPAPQLAAHAPAAHTVPAGHAAPHAPQCSPSRWRSAQRAGPPSDAHIALPAGHVSAQRPPSQRSPPAQAAPHAPQFALSESSETQRSPHRVAPPAHPASLGPSSLVTPPSTVGASAAGATAMSIAVERSAEAPASVTEAVPPSSEQSPPPRRSTAPRRHNRSIESSQPSHRTVLPLVYSIR
ncbi:MAG: hypothetical protein R3A48_21800 [Polyangiales bacterium]